MYLYEQLKCFLSIYLATQSTFGTHANTFSSAIQKSFKDIVFIVDGNGHLVH